MIAAVPIALALALSPGASNQRRQREEARYRRLEELRSLDATSATSTPQSPLQKELDGLESLGDPYDASLFTAEHAAFKAGHNLAFSDLARYLTARPDHSPCPVFYLDGSDGATSAALIAAGFDRETDLFVANEWEESVAALRSEPFLLVERNCLLGRAQDVLRTGRLQGMPFVAAYLDGCGGAPGPILEMVEALFSGIVAPAMAVGFTLTAAEPGGRDLIDRVQDVTRGAMRIAGKGGFDMRHVGDDPARYAVDPGPPRKVDGTTTCWLVFSKE